VVNIDEVNHCLSLFPAPARVSTRITDIFIQGRPFGHGLATTFDPLTLWTHFTRSCRTTNNTSKSSQICIFENCLLWFWPLNQWPSQCYRFNLYLLAINCDQFYSNISIRSEDTGKVMDGPIHTSTHGRATRKH